MLNDFNKHFILAIEGRVFPQSQRYPMIDTTLSTLRLLGSILKHRNVTKKLCAHLLSDFRILCHSVVFITILQCYLILMYSFDYSNQE